MDPERKKRALRTLTYGLHIASAAQGEDLAAAAVNWVSQASFTPPLLMIALRVDSNLHRLTASSRKLALNVLAAKDKQLAADFFKTLQVGPGRLNGHSFHRGAFSGAALLEEAWAWLELRVTDIVERGDHSVFVAEVMEAAIRETDARALVMWDTDWYYGG
jgi:flavin reductase (DIM6/NTAB) family NADH-FMN oxidoreductase RutF